jgi:hypothetical protein
MITTSAASLRASRFGIVSGELPIEPPYFVTILVPLVRSNSGASSVNAAVNAPDIRTLISGVCARGAASVQNAVTTIARRVRRDIVGNLPDPALNEDQLELCFL